MKITKINVKKMIMMKFVLLNFFILWIEAAMAVPFEKSDFIPNPDRPQEIIRLFSYFADDSDGNPPQYSADAIIFIQGRNEFSEMYTHVAESFIRSYKTDVFLYDLRGQGESSGPRCHIDSYDQYVSDLHALIVRLKKNYGYKNIHISTHSTGGLIASLLAAEHPEDFGEKGSLILASPFFEMKGSSTLQMAAKALSKVFSLTSWTSQWPSKKRECMNYEQNDLTDHRKFFDKYANHPEKCGPATWGWINASFAAQAKLRKVKLQIAVPMLLLTAGNDSVVNSEASIAFCKDLNQTRPGLCHMKDYPGMKHILYHERAKNKVLKQIRKFRLGLLK